MDTSLRAYAERLEKSLKKATPIGLYNKDIIHASIIVHLTFLHAKKEISILSNKLDLALYGVAEIRKSIRTFLKKQDVKLNILVEQEIGPKHPLVNINREFKQKVEIRTVRKEVLESYKFNFMIVDDIGYRFERDRDSCAATASFYEKDEDSKEFIKSLKEIFQILRKRSNAINIRLPEDAP